MGFKVKCLYYICDSSTPKLPLKGHNGAGGHVESAGRQGKAGEGRGRQGDT